MKMHFLYFEIHKCSFFMSTFILTSVEIFKNKTEIISVEIFSIVFMMPVRWVDCWKNETRQRCFFFQFLITVLDEFPW